MGEAALVCPLRLELIDDIVKDIIQREEPIAPLEILQIVFLNNFNKARNHRHILYLPQIDPPQKPNQKVPP